MKKRKLIYTGLLMLSLVTIPVYASDTNIEAVQGIASFNQGNASIVIQGQDSQSMVGKTFRVYKLFDAKNSTDNTSVHYTLNPVYAQKVKSLVASKVNKTVDDQDVVDYMMSLDADGNQSEYRYFIEAIQKEISSLDSNVVHVTSCDVDGNITLDKLAYGFYLIDEVSNVSNMHAASSLTLVNTANPNASLQLKSDYPSVIKKIYEDDHEIGWNDIGDFEINQDIQYKYESKVPDMSGYSSYFFEFEDEMDSGLSYKEDSIQIQIGSQALSKDRYVLTKTEKGFKVSIQNLKAISNIKAKDSIVLTYHAYLNSTAAQKVGDQGYENKVRLNFSNDPQSESKGQTPWDSVVCFTYKLNALKVNEKDVKLEGATFKLYRDANCTDVVSLEKVKDTYVVSGQKDEALVSDAQGSFIVSGLDQGTYYLKEIQAPDGYKLLKEPIEFTITPTFIQERNNYVSGDEALVNLDATSFSNVLNTSKSGASVALKVVNKTGSKLPITGSSGTLICMVGGASILLYVFKKKKEE